MLIKSPLSPLFFLGKEICIQTQKGILTRCLLKDNYLTRKLLLKKLGNCGKNISRYILSFFYPTFYIMYGVLQVFNILSIFLPEFQRNTIWPIEYRLSFFSYQKSHAFHFDTFRSIKMKPKAFESTETKLFHYSLLFQFLCLLIHFSLALIKKHSLF